MALITLLTDFGLSDSYVAEVKAVLLSEAGGGGVGIVDISHLVGPGNVAEGQYLLSRSWRRFPPGTVHLAVVDPGVGTDRRAVAAEADGHLFVAPDNGILSFLPPAAVFVLLQVPPGASPTFQARDVFAPAAARLARGAKLLELGPRITDPHRFPLPGPRTDGVAQVGSVIHVDRFGTLVTNIPGERVEPGVRIIVEDVDCGPVRRTFGDVERGKLVAYIGSDGLVEVAVRDGNAARQLGVGVGAGVRA